ncbi:MAG: MerR family transcriptional regulator [Actinobacteria bacterium]|nr:MerR family transcriptional regulator [Actinomycetota bacterium]
MKNGLFSIGDFSRMCRLTVKALRLYDEQGIFKPGHVDPASGYRYYSSAQLAEADLIRLLRSLELPLEDIRRFVREDDPGRRNALLEEHRHAIEERAEGYRSIASSIERLLEEEEDVMEMKVEIKELAGQPVLGVRFKTDMSEVGCHLGKSYGALFAYLGKTGESPAGPPFGLYHDGEYKEEDADVEACVSTAKLLPGEGDVKGYELSGAKVASTLHMGPFEQIGDTYRELMLWISEQGYRPSKPCREIYLVGPEQSDDPADYRTEVQCPIVEIQ